MTGIEYDKALPAKQPKPLTLEEFVKKHAKPGESAQQARDRLYVSWTKQSGGVL